MAQEKKGKGKAQKASDATTEEKTSKAAETHEDEHVAAKEAHDEKDHGGAAAHAGGHDEHHKPNRKEIWMVFGALFLLTALEVVIAQPDLHVPKTMMRLGLVGMALAKAAIVALFYMHLKHETRIMRLTVAIPIATPAFYAVVLISEAAWRLIR